MSITDSIQNSCRYMGMLYVNENPFAFGNYYSGDNMTLNGFFWYMNFEHLLSVSRCDFTFLRPTTVTMADEFLYLALRLDYAAHLLPEKSWYSFKSEGTRPASSCPQAEGVSFSSRLYIPARNP